MGTAEIITDAGRAYIKAMGNRQGPHALACEYVGTQFARWFGLPTFDHAILTLGEDDEIPLHSRGQAQAGPAFVTRAEPGRTWGGGEEELGSVVNPDDLARLVLFDTWTLNCDRHPPELAARKPNYDNVFLSEERADAGRFRLVAMDHTHCFTCGRDLRQPVATIGRIKDERVYGLFPGFVSTLQARRAVVEAGAEVLRAFDRDRCRKIVESIPVEWSVDDAARDGLCELVCQRAAFVADHMTEWLAPTCWRQGEFRFDTKGEGA
jgi:hypothetical protein